ncbi:helix-turn-helix transcriptional regulator [Gryllotalpicola reticulitermitis]|uniref:Helix-turn-helix transcriptional regulator n=1 Tax=Gryllotalpicola reticulitermitis TaxID=1184153 RepID=A0ABV8Q2T6_9MICO
MKLETSLGATIRAWRDRLPPEAVGLPAVRGRRATGLRREELAEIAQISVDYVVKLEQGRVGTPSAQILSSLARALQLTREERDHLYLLAGLQPPADGMLTEHIPPGMQRVISRLGETPAAVFAADWRLVWWNRPWAAVLGDPRTVEPADRNLVKSRFPTAEDRGRIAIWPVAAENAEGSDRAIVSDLRRASGRYPADERLAGLIARTIEGNPRFAQLWAEGAVGGHAEDRKTVTRPGVGEITLDCDVLNDSDTDLKVVIYTARPGSDDETKLRLALVDGAAALQER